MHGRVKVRTTEEQERIKQAEREVKLKEFRRGMQFVFDKREKKELDDELLVVIEKIVVRNPDIYTLWNIRREVILNTQWTDEERFKAYEKELLLTELCLRENPKSYCVWHHRVWINGQWSDSNNWKKELKLCNKCLDLDERNFHCWDYRRYVANKANIPDSEELDFTMEKLEKNFSNYSAWYHRSKLLQKLYPSNVHDLPIRSDKHDEELDLVMNAIFTDPKDSSAWFYHRWLLDFSAPQYTLWQAVLTKNQITAVFHIEVSSDIKLYLNNEQVKCKWESANKQDYSFIWSAKFEEPLGDNCNDVSLKFGESVFNMKKSDSKDAWIYKSEMMDKNHNIAKLNEQLDNYKQLAIMEPKNKWAKLTTYYLMLRIDPIERHDDIIKILNDLMGLDPLRINYYKDMRSKCILDYRLNSTDDKNDGSIDLSNSELTTLSSHVHYLSFYREVNLSNNSLGNKLYQLYALKECETLDLSNNAITSLKTFPTLNCLKTLLLPNNKITNSDEVVEVIKRHKLTKLDLRSNLISGLDSLVDNIKNTFPNVEVLV